jgi:peptidoglycan hydrolase-like protein with peptidoglycan-binding domain
LFLVKQGYLKAPASGYFGPVTEAALKVYQKEHNIEQTGVAGSATAASIATQ